MVVEFRGRASMPDAPTTTVVIDNGGHTCKVGLAGQAEPVRSMMNGIAKSKTEHKVFVADQLNACKDFSALQYRLSLERGCLVNWDVQSQVWARAFGSEVLKVSPADCSLLLSEIPLCPTAIQDTLDEMVFEHFGFHSYCTRPAPVLAALALREQQAASPPHPASLGAPTQEPQHQLHQHQQHPPPARPPACWRAH